jgi:uncharacterized membrane protein YfbV (UPF0208 family)
MGIHLLCAAAAVIALALPQRGGWTLGEDAATKQNPLSADPKTLAAGKAILKD